MKVLFCGDIMPGGVLCYQDVYASDEIKNIFSDADLRVGTLECALGDNLPFDKKKMELQYGKNIVYAPENSLKRVNEMGFNVVTLANNHIFDLGPEGLANTIKLLDEAGIKHCGAGSNIKEASDPCYINCCGKVIAFIGCCFNGLPPYVVEAASEFSPGIFQTDEEGICKVIANAKLKADYVVVLPHWGKEYSYMPPDRCFPLSKSMVEAGADAVMGSHPHIINPQITYKEKPIYFSMGNFLFPDFCLQVPRPIWYPETKKEVYMLPTVLNYPKCICEPVRVVWDIPSRIGYIVSISFSDSLEVKDYLSVLNKDNVLELLSGEKEQEERKRMSILSNRYTCPCQRLFRGFKNKFVSIITRIKIVYNRIFISQ